jgi:hypothetical protein
MSSTAISCPSCGASIEREFCPECGERRPHAHDLSPKHLAEQTVEGVTHLDAKVPRSALLLLTKPGFLAAEFVRGARKRYVRPTTLFLVANAAYYLLQPLTGFNTFRTTLELHARQLYGGYAKRVVEAKLAARGIDHETYAKAFDARIDSLSKLLLFAFVPALAAVFALLHWKQRRAFGEHLVLALHFAAFLLTYVYLLFVPLQANLTRSFLPEALRGEGFESLLTLSVLAVYLTSAFRRMYGGGTASAIARAIAATIGYAILLMSYRAALFFITFWMT